MIPRSTRFVFALLLLAGGCSQSPATQSAASTAEPPPEPSATEPSAEAPPPAIRARSVSPVLRVSAPPTRDDATRASTTLAEARRLSDAGDRRGALERYDRVAATVPAFEDWAHLLAAGTAAAAGDTAEVRRRLGSSEPVRAREWGWTTVDHAYLVARDSAGALAMLEAAAPRISEPARRADALHRIGARRAQRGEGQAAVAAFRAAMEAAPASRPARDAATAIASLPRGPEDRLAEGRTWLRHGNVDRGFSAIQAYLQSGAGSSAARADVGLVLGRALFNARRYADAERVLLAVTREPDAPPAIAAEALLLAGRSQFRDGRRDPARVTLAAVAERYPREPFAAQALFILGDLDHDAGRSGTARGHFQRAASLEVDSPDAALSAVRAASMLMLDGQPAAAAALLDRFAESRPSGRFLAQASYWSGRAHHAAGNREAAMRRFDAARAADPISYYGKLAADRTGGTLDELPIAPDPQIERATEIAVEIALFRVDLLRDLGLEDLSAFEMVRAREDLDGHAGALYLIAEAHLARGAPVAGMLLGREIHRIEGAWNQRLLRIVFPFPHRELVEREARRHGLDPFMVAGLIRQESMFNPNAVSPAGAIGLMQVMPATGQMLARRAGVSGFQPSMLRQPELNVRLGTLFLADLLARNGSPTEAFAAYNAGPGRLAQWRSFPEFRDEEMFAERIPFQETRDYVKILNFNTRLYRMLYGG
jgi:soluble lytic murein transglycosylase